MREPLKATVYRFGDRYRVVGLYNEPPRNSGGVRGLSDEKSACNLYRARARVRELAFCNPWEWFVTITINAENQDRFDLDEFKKRWSQCLKDYGKKYGVRPSYLLVPEQHKNGAWHAHGLLHDMSPESMKKNEHGYLDVPYFRNRFGFVSLSKVRDLDATRAYITKYVSKSLGDGVEVGKHLYLSSNGLARKSALCKVWIALDWQYSCDFCAVYETKDFNELDTNIIKEIKI